MLTFLSSGARRLTQVNDQVIRRVLEAVGMEFIDADGVGPGVRLRQAKNL